MSEINMNLKPPLTEGTVSILVMGVAAYVSYPTSAKIPIVERGLRIRTDKCFFSI